MNRFEIVGRSLSFNFIVAGILMLVLFFSFVLPVEASLIPCDGTDCTMCNFADLVNTLIKLLFGAVAVVFVIMMTVAGFGLVTSAGNPGALSEAKSKFVNALIGLLIMLSAWLLVDTLMRSVMTNGEIAGWGPWAEVKCMAQEVPIALKDLENEKEEVSTTPPPSPQPTPGGMVSLRAMGLNVASWPGIDGPGRTDLAVPSAANAAKAMQDAGIAKFGKKAFQITAAYTDNVGHSVNSKHYQGIAIDFQPIGGVTKEQVAQLARDAGFTYVLIESKHVHADMR